MLFELLGEVLDIHLVDWFARTYIPSLVIFTLIKRVYHQVLEDHFDNPINGIKINFQGHVGVCEPKFFSGVLYLKLGIRLQLEGLFFHIYPFQLEFSQYLLILLTDRHLSLFCMVSY